ncbi:MAG: MotA/TolQ/ExbB proton channel family protein [Spongiibacteraceae bacterium]
MNLLPSLFSNSIVWLILVCALPCYALLLELIFTRQKNTSWNARSHSWLDCLQTTITALPLLGLLGTITGLLKTFTLLSVAAMNTQTLISGGIADALFTTEVGLLIAIPGWLMIAWLRGQMQLWELQQCAPA